MIVKGKRRRVAWGITGSGEKIEETVEIMEEMKKEYRKEFDFKKTLKSLGSFKDLKDLRGKSKISSLLDFDFLSPCTIFK